MIGSLGNEITDSVVAPAIRGKSTELNTVAKVINADESSNNCTVIYYDSDGNRATAENCMVDLRNGDTGWFPKKNDMVCFMANGHGSGLITSQYTDNFIKDIKSKLRLKCDVLNDGDPTLCGGHII